LAEPKSQGSESHLQTFWYMMYQGVSLILITDCNESTYRPQGT